MRLGYAYSNYVIGHRYLKRFFPQSVKRAPVASNHACHHYETFQGCLLPPRLPWGHSFQGHQIPLRGRAETYRQNRRSNPGGDKQCSLAVCVKPTIGRPWGLARDPQRSDQRQANLAAVGMRRERQSPHPVIKNACWIMGYGDLQRAGALLGKFNIAEVFQGYPPPKCFLRPRL